VLTEFVLPGISFALSATLIPGPLQAYLLNVTLRYGWRRGLLVTISPLLVDAPIIVLVVFLLGQLPEVAIQAIRFAGGALLLYIAWGAYQQMRSGATFKQADVHAEKQGDKPLRILGTAMLLNALSPGPWLFWATVNGPLLLSALEQSPLHAIAFLVAFYGSFVASLNVLVFAFSRLGSLGPDITRYVLMFTIALLLFFGTALIAEALSLTELHRQISLVVAILAAIWFGWRYWQRKK
jgi:threonine/homoserine/homoserine lactone efflux protein